MCAPTRAVPVLFKIIVELMDSDVYSKQKKKKKDNVCLCVHMHTTAVIFCPKAKRVTAGHFFRLFFFYSAHDLGKTAEAFCGCNSMISVKRAITAN